MNDIRFVVSPRIMGEEKFFGPGIAVLLHRVDAYHSIRQATMSMGMAYSKAWAIIRRAEKESLSPLLKTLLSYCVHGYLQSFGRFSL